MTESVTNHYSDSVLYHIWWAKSALTIGKVRIWCLDTAFRDVPIMVPVVLRHPLP